MRGVKSRTAEPLRSQRMAQNASDRLLNLVADKLKNQRWGTVRVEILFEAGVIKRVRAGGEDLFDED